MIALFRRACLPLLLVAAVAFTPAPTPLVAQSSTNARYAAIVVDAQTGEVLFQRFADDRRFPASITKVMTLYLTFEALSKGRIHTSDVLTISRHAASMPPSKLGLAAGQTITLDDAMKATAVRSANDMAVAIAEHIAGSEAGFAQRMTAKARELGMTRTTFYTANGLPDSRQATSAKDLSILARAIMRDYPQFYRYFGIDHWDYNGRDYRNTNGLLRTGVGYDGMKTGYTNASGYNLAASSVRGDKRLITIVMGGRSTASRNAHVAELMDTGFDFERARDRGQTRQIAQAFFEGRGYGINVEVPPVQYAAADTEDEDGAVAYTAAPAAPPQPRRPAPNTRANAAAAPVQDDDVTRTLNARTAAAVQPSSNPGWQVQVGAFRDESLASSWLGEVSRRFPAQFRGSDRSVQNADGWYRSRFTGLTEVQAQAACAALSERRVTCMVIRPQQ